MSTEIDYKEIFTSNDGSMGTPRELMGHPRPLQASRKLMQMIEDAQREHATQVAFADWLANFMERYAASFAHPVFDVSEGADGSGPNCSFCGAIWPMCGHHHMSDWVPAGSEVGESDTGKENQ